MANMERKINRKYELIPNDSHKSFYGKAIVYCDNFGNEFLRSYDTIVAVKDYEGKVYNTWGDYSATTQRHIKAFCGMNKKEYDNAERVNCKYSAYDLEWMYQNR